MPKCLCCGNEVAPYSLYCPNCLVAQQSSPSNQQSDDDEDDSKEVKPK